MAEQGVTRVDALDVQWTRTEHTVYSAGYLVANSGVSMIYSVDTTNMDDLWSLGWIESGLAAVFIETSFLDRLEALALEMGHLTSALVVRGLKKLDKPEVPVRIFHMKPQYLDEIRSRCSRGARYYMATRVLFLRRPQPKMRFDNGLV